MPAKEMYRIICNPAKENWMDEIKENVFFFYYDIAAGEEVQYSSIRGIVITKFTFFCYDIAAV